MPQGLTARFNRNILAHLNARFHGDFVPERFAHRAFFNEEASQIEIYLVSEGAQRARLDDLDLDVDVHRRRDDPYRDLAQIRARRARARAQGSRLRTRRGMDGPRATGSALMLFGRGHG